MGMLAKIRRMHFREGCSVREIARRTGLSRNTVRGWLRREGMQEPRYPARVSPSVLDPYKEQLQRMLVSDQHRVRRERRTGRVLYQLLQAQGYPGGYGRVVAFIRSWREQQTKQLSRSGFVPLKFEPGEAFQFDWSCEYLTLGGIRRRLEVAHVKLAASRVFHLVAYPMQSHEMLFDAHTRAFSAFGGIPRRGIYDNMKTAVDRVGRGKERTVNARFQAMCGHYLFEPEFCNRAAGWEKGIVEKNVQDRRRQLWQSAARLSWSCLSGLNDWLANECTAAWSDLRHPQWPQLSLADVFEEERGRLMPLPRPFDGYVEHSVRVSSTALVTYQRNRYSVPSEHAHGIISLHVYPSELVMIADGQEVARHVRSFERDRTFYDWQHYIPLLERTQTRRAAQWRPLRHPAGAAAALAPAPARPSRGRSLMAQVLAAVPVHGVEAVQVAAELALESGRPSGEHVLNVLARLKGSGKAPEQVATALQLQEEPLADVQRYDDLRATQEICHVK